MSFCSHTNPPGPFITFKLATDLNYSPILDFEERDFVVAGPGAVDGIRKCFVETAGLSNEDVIKAMADIGTNSSAPSASSFSIFGEGRYNSSIVKTSSAKLISIAEWLIRGCPVRRRAHQNWAGRYVPNGEPMRRLYPEKWRLNTSLERQPIPRRL